MAEYKTIAVAILNGGNYSTWKVQCRMPRQKEGAYGAAAAQHEEDSSEEGTGLLVSHALTVQSSDTRGKWMVNSGATSHMCNSQTYLGNLEPSVSIRL